MLSKRKVCLIINFFLIVPMFMVTAMSIAVPVAKAQEPSPEQTKVKLNPSVLSVIPYKFAGEQAGAGGTSIYSFKGGKLYCQIGSLYIDTDNVVDFGSIDFGADADGNAVVGYWRRYPVVWAVNIYTTLNHLDATIGNKEVKTSVNVQYAFIKTVVNGCGYNGKASSACCTCKANPIPFAQIGTDVKKSYGVTGGSSAADAGPSLSSSCTIPGYNIANDNKYGVASGSVQLVNATNPDNLHGATIDYASGQVTDLYNNFQSKYGFNGDLQFKLTVNPSIGAPTSFKVGDNKFTSLATAVRLDSVFTTNNQNVGSKTYDPYSDGLVSGAAGKNVIIGGTAKDEQTKQTETDVDKTGTTSYNDMNSNVKYATKGLGTPTTTGANYPYSINSGQSGASIQLFKDDGVTPQQSSTDFASTVGATSFIAKYPISEFRPQLDLTTTSYPINWVSGVLQTGGGWFDDLRGIVPSYGPKGGVCSVKMVSSYGVENVYMHVQFGAYIDVCSKYKIEVPQKSGGGEPQNYTSISLPNQNSGNYTFNAQADDEMAWLAYSNRTWLSDWNDFWKGVFGGLFGGELGGIIGIVIVVAIIILALWGFGKVRGAFGGGGGGTTKIQFAGQPGGGWGPSGSGGPTWAQLQAWQEQQMRFMASLARTAPVGAAPAPASAYSSGLQMPEVVPRQSQYQSFDPQSGFRVEYPNPNSPNDPQRYYWLVFKDTGKGKLIAKEDFGLYKDKVY